MFTATRSPPRWNKVALNLKKNRLVGGSEAVFTAATTEKAANMDEIIKQKSRDESTEGHLGHLMAVEPEGLNSAKVTGEWEEIEIAVDSGATETVGALAALWRVALPRVPRVPAGPVSSDETTARWTRARAVRSSSSNSWS